MKVPNFSFWFFTIPGAWAGFLFGCTTPPDYPVEPHIEYVGVSKDTLQRGDFNDQTIVTFTFTDGDGDLGWDDSLDLVVKDSRPGLAANPYQRFLIPEVPKLGASNGIKGEIQLLLYTTCCIFPPDLGEISGCFDEDPSYPYDEVVFEIFIRDRAGHQSNLIQTQPIYIRCFE